MSFRATIVLGVIAAGLGLYVYLVEVQGERSRQQAVTEAKRLLSFESEQITALEVPLEGGGSAKLVAAGEGDSRSWSLETPVVFPADPRFVSNLLSTLTRLESETRGDHSEYDRSPKTHLSFDASTSSEFPAAQSAPVRRRSRDSGTSRPAARS